VIFSISSQVFQKVCFLECIYLFLKRVIHKCVCVCVFVFVCIMV
jgi:hypothetical protein